MTTNTKPSIAFFGATGGCTNAALALALKDGYKCSALARTPSKLRKLLSENHAVSPSTMNTNLTIIQGSAKDLSPVKQTLAPGGVPASIVLSGLGGAPKVQWSLTCPFTLDDPNICHEAMSILLQALRELRREGVIAEAQRPFVACISTTGTQKMPRDIPIAYYGFYHWALQVPHKDKRVMEAELARASKESGAEAPIGAFAIVRPTFMFDGDSKGMEKVRSGWVVHPEAVNAGETNAPGPAIGYTIRRDDVGLWMFEELVKRTAEWENKAVTLTF